VVTLLRRVCEGEGIDAPDAALALVARSARGSFRDAVSTLDQLAAATGSSITPQDVLQLVGAVEEDALFRLCDTVVDGDTAGALVQIEALAEQGQDLGRLVTDLVEHLRHLLLVQHVGSVPDSIPVTDEARDRLREQANQLPEPTVLRLIDLLATAVEDMRQGADPRLPLELAIVRVTRPHADLQRESLAHRVELIEARLAGTMPPRTSEVPSRPAHASAPDPPASTIAQPPSGGAEAEPALELSQLQDAWSQSILPAVEHRSIPVKTLLIEARPSALSGATLTLEFAAAADFHRRQIEEPKNLSLVRDALFEVTGRHLVVTTALAAPVTGEDAPQEEPDEDAFISLLKDTFDAEEVEGG
jgi:DNA polymerase-3 subunit gamma/tau